MTRTVHCQLMDHEGPGLDFQPYPGELGQRIYENICAEGWQRWLAHQTMLGLSGNCPAVTGAAKETILGGIFPA